MKAYYSDTFVLPLPEGHRFPMQKYSMLRRWVAAARVIAPDDLRLPDPAGDADLLRAHDQAYVERVKTGTLTPQEVRLIGFPWSPELVERSRHSVGATIAACRAALEEGLAANLAGGTHHACSDHGEGFCVFNDSVVAARALQAEGRVKRIVVIDCDVHQGNGTAQICAGDESIFTFSIHSARNYPFKKEQSDLDIGLDDRAGDDTYLYALERGVRTALEQARPDLAIYLAGADPYYNDRLGRLSLTKGGLWARDHLVFSALQQLGIPFVITMAGGYGRVIEDTVDIHFETIRLAAMLR